MASDYVDSLRPGNFPCIYAAVAHALDFFAGDIGHKDFFIGGFISGELTQTVFVGSSTTEVTAYAESGYRFLRWSDGKTSPTRTDIAKNELVVITAEFEFIG